MRPPITTAAARLAVAGFVVAAVLTATSCALPAPTEAVAAERRSHSASAAAPAAPAAATTPVRYHGGPVMTGPVRLYVIWLGEWSANPTRKRILVHFMSHLTSPWFAINRGYPDAAGRRVQNSVRLVRQISVAVPAAPARLTDAHLADTVRRALDAKRFPVDRSGIYLVLTHRSVDKVGFLTRHCGWHDYFWYGSTTIKYAFVGDPTGPNLRVCAPQTVSPNGDAGADAMASTIAHEVAEAVTNPEFTGWFDDGGYENADKCAWQYGRRYRVGRAWANMRLGRRHYYIQMNWSNTPGVGCTLGT